MFYPKTTQLKFRLAHPACCSRSFCSKLVDDFRMPLLGTLVKFSAIAK